MRIYFNINTNRRYLYPTPHRVAIELANVPDRGTHEGFVVLTREVGTSKTTLLNRLLESLHQQWVTMTFVFKRWLTRRFIIVLQMRTRFTFLKVSKAG